MSPRRVFVIVTGLPGSGKSSVGRVVSRVLGLPLLDKDEILEGLFDTLGSADPVAREGLSRAADELLLRLAAQCPGAVLVNWWNRDTAPGRLGALGGELVEVLADAPPEVAARPWRERSRHPGHHDRTRTTRAITDPFEPMLGDPMCLRFGHPWPARRGRGCAAGQRSPGVPLTPLLSG